LILGLQHLPRFLEQGFEPRLRFDVALAALQTLMMSFNNRRVFCHFDPPNLKAFLTIEVPSSQCNLRALRYRREFLHPRFYKILM
jgi:hypothetical protein